MKITFDLFKGIALVLFVIAMIKLRGTNEFWVLLVLYLNTWSYSFEVKK